MSEPEALLAFRDVACIRGGRMLFEGMNLRLDAGEAALVSGPNGVGKSSLIRLAAGLLRPAAGGVTRAAAALADENMALDPRLTLERALGFWARLDGVSPAAGIEAMGLAALAKVPVRMLSSGQRKRATLARVITSGSPLWLLDEPANGLDSEARERLAAALAGHRRSGGAVLAASHEPIRLDGATEIAL